CAPSLALLLDREKKSKNQTFFLLRPIIKYLKCYRIADLAFSIFSIFKFYFCFMHEFVIVLSYWIFNGDERDITNAIWLFMTGVYGFLWALFFSIIYIVFCSLLPLMQSPFFMFKNLPTFNMFEQLSYLNEIYFSLFLTKFNRLVTKLRDYNVDLFFSVLLYEC
ncbi:hypothetical protein ACJX0J_036883, partial [Zea mays]